MYILSENNLTAFNDKIKGYDREFSVRLHFTAPTDETLTGTTIQSISVDEVVNSTDTLTLGCACSNKIVVKLIEPPTDIDYGNGVFTAYVGLKIDEENTVEVPLGKFYVTSAETSNDFKSLTLTGYDGFCKMTEVYESAIDGETTLQAVYNDLRRDLEGYGITLKEAKLPEYSLTFHNIKDITYQQAIGYVAGCLGGFARFDRGWFDEKGEYHEPELEIATYIDSGVVVDRSLQYMDGFKKTIGKSLKVCSMVTGTQDNQFEYGEGGNGVDINFENPYITEKMANAVWAKYDGVTYTPGQVKWRGNPCVQAGDVVQAVDKYNVTHNVLVMSQTVKIGGGLNSTIECKGKSEVTSNFSSRFESVGQKIDRVYSTLEQAIISATKAITGNSGGYIKLNDTNGDGRPDEFVITDHEDIKQATKVWRWNLGGLGYADNGYDGSYKTAITADGQIVADMITTGTLNAELVHLEDGYGNEIYMDGGVIKLENKNGGMSLSVGAIPQEEKEPNATALYSNFRLDRKEFPYLLLYVDDISQPHILFAESYTHKNAQFEFNNAYTQIAKAGEYTDMSAIIKAFNGVNLGNIIPQINLTPGDTIYYANFDAPEGTSYNWNRIDVYDESTAYQVAFYNEGKKMAHFTQNSFEIDNIIGGKIRFQNFGFVPRETGNLTFTKLI